MINVLIADDHPIFLQGLKQVLSEADDIHIAGEAHNGSDVMKLFHQETYDVITLDINMPGMNGIDVLKQIRIEQPEQPVLVLSIYPEEQYALRALKAGASGYLTKTSVPREFIAAIRKVSEGGRYITASIAERLAMDLNNKDIEHPHEKLSDREFEILIMIGRGLTVSDIAGELNLSVKTVSTHRSHILKKMNMDSNAQLMRYTLERHLTD